MLLQLKIGLRTRVRVGVLNSHSGPSIERV